MYFNHEKIELSDNQPIDNSIIKSDFTTTNKQNWMMQIKLLNSYLEKRIIITILVMLISNYDMTIRKNDNTNFNGETIRRINNALADTFKEAQLATTGGSDFEHNKYFGRISTSMRLIACEDEDLLSCFDKIYESINKITSKKTN